MSDHLPESAGPEHAGRVPRATYRFQFNRGFTFRDAAELVPYLAELGISDVYASPYLRARPGSAHGYDITDHAALNPEIGTEEEHSRLAARIREQGLGHLLDIVPNHMGIGGGDNRWWMDVLENGQSSPYAPFFDIDWHPLQREMQGKVLLPILGDAFGAVLERGELHLRHEDGRFRIDYFEHHLPVAPRSSAAVLREALDVLGGALPAEHPDRMELESIVTALHRLPPRHLTDPEHVAERRREKVVAARRLRELYHASAEVRAALDEAVRRFNGTPGDPHSFDRLEALLDDQAYRLAFWRVAAEEINYRRFFDINELAGVRAELPRVFEETHRLVLRLVREGKVTGLRIDHPDGLYHPRAYLRRLQEEASGRADGDFYVLVEKILTGDEELPADWPVAGTVGYELLNHLNGVFVARENEGALDAAYRAFVRRPPEFEELVHEKKRLILRAALVSELTVLAHLLKRLADESRRSRDFTLGSLRDALRETIAAFPVYRTYIDAHAGVVPERDRAYVERAVRAARRRNRTTSRLIFDFIRDLLLLRWPEGLDEAARSEHARFVMKFQQLTGPVMAKGVEDTSFYVYNRLVSLNEVGGEPDRFGVTPEELHRWMRERMERWPHAMSATSTHDTKRSEDVRARINVLSEIPDAWRAHALRWAHLNAPKKSLSEEGAPIPDANDEYLLYQTLLGAWPLEEMDDAAYGVFVERIRGYMEKATREAKVHTSWINPDEEYDTALGEFVSAVLSREGEGAFLEDFHRLRPVVARLGMLNSLSQTLLKLTCPGVPDVYRGQELWDFSLVDPDNRRPVDWAVRKRRLAELRERVEGGELRALAHELVEQWEDGRIKLYVTWRALRLRAAHPLLFRDGEYLPLTPVGERAEHVLAFARRGAGSTAVVAVPRLVAGLTRDREWALPDAELWRGTWVEGPAEVLGGSWRNIFTGEELRAEERGAGVGLAAEALFGSFPVALLERA